MLDGVHACMLLCCLMLMQVILWPRTAAAPAGGSCCQQRQQQLCFQHSYNHCQQRLLLLRRLVDAPATACARLFSAPCPGCLRFPVVTVWARLLAPITRHDQGSCAVSTWMQLFERPVVVVVIAVLVQGFRELYDPILAYKFIYPVVTSAGQDLQMTLTHPPEKVGKPVSADHATPTAAAAATLGATLALLPVRRRLHCTLNHASAANASCAGF